VSNNVYIVDFDGEIYVIEPVPGAGGAFSASAVAAPQALSVPQPATMSREELNRLAREALRESLRRR